MAVFRTAVKVLSPAPLQEGTGERYMYIFGLLLDALMQKMTEGGLSRMPTKCDPSFLPLIGEDRLIGQGLTESVDSYRARLQRAFESWQLAGSARGVMGQVLGYLLALTPMVRTVSSRYSGNIADLLFVTDATNDTPIVVKTKRPHRLSTGDSVDVEAVAGNTAANGTWTVTVLGAYTFELDTSVGSGSYTSGGYVIPPGFPTAYPPTLMSSTWDTYAAGQNPSTPPAHVLNLAASAVGANWDWDSLSQVAGSWGWWGSWLIIFAVAPNTVFTAAPTWGSGVRWGSGRAWGVNQSATVGRSILGIVGQWKGAHTWLRWLVVSFDASLFDPSQPAGGGVNPDGLFGRWSKVVNGRRVRSRFSDARYGKGIS